MSDMSEKGYGVSPAGAYPVQLGIEYPQESSRLLALFTIPFALGRIILLIPMFIVLYALGIAAFIVFVISQWAVVFTGRYPQGMHSFMVGYLRWSVRVQSFFYGLTDKYPPFSLSE
jgi:hypothetical protein